MIESLLPHLTYHWHVRCLLSYFFTLYCMHDIPGYQVWDVDVCNALLEAQVKTYKYRVEFVLWINVKINFKIMKLFMSFTDFIRRDFWNSFSDPVRDQHTEILEHMSNDKWDFIRFHFLLFFFSPHGGLASMRIIANYPMSHDKHEKKGNLIWDYVTDT